MYVDYAISLKFDIVYVDFDNSYRLSGGMCVGGDLNFNFIRETLLLLSPLFLMAFMTLRLCFPFFFFFFVFLFGFREIHFQMLV